MPSKKLSARNVALNHLQAALDTGVRGDLREAVQKARDIALGNRVSDVTDMEYRQLAEGSNLGDPRRPGLVMRHGKRIGRQWIYRFDHPKNGKQVNLTFGRYPDLDVASARQRWGELREQRQAGHVPNLATNNAGEPTGPTMDQLVRRFLTDYVRPVKAASSAREDERMLTKHILPHYANLPAKQFDHVKAKGVLSKLHRGGAPREAEKLRSVLSTMFNVAVGKTRKISTLDGSWLPPDHPNPVEAVMLPKRDPKRHTPDKGELRSYIRSLPDLGFYGDVFRTQIETFSRIAEVTGMSWNEIDLDDGTWTLPNTRSKNGKAHTVMLAAQTIDRLQRIKASTTSAFVFPARTDDSQQLSASLTIQTLAKNRDTMGISRAFTSHATRHAALTWVAENGGGRDIRDRLSNHSPPKDGADHIYVAAEHNKAAREWTQRWADHLVTLESDNVVQIGEAHV